MSQALLAAQGGLSQGYLSQLENDEVQNPSAAVIFGLARALHVDPRLLMRAAGYGEASLGAPGDDAYAVEVDPDLLRFLAEIPKERQGHLLEVLKGLEAGNRGKSRVPRMLPTQHRTHVASATSGRKVAAK
jgi:transcriptional regulator with XRE-family HTH domain